MASVSKHSPRHRIANLDQPATSAGSAPGAPRRRALAAIPVAALAGVLLSSTTPAFASPTPNPSGAAPAVSAAADGPTTAADVTATLASLAHQNEQLAEQFNAAVIDLATKQQAAGAAQVAADQALTQWKQALAQSGTTLTEQFKTTNFSSAGALLTSSSSQNYLDVVSDLAAIAHHNSAVLDRLSAARGKALAAKSAADSAVAQASALRDSLVKQKADVDAKESKYQAMLATLTAPQRQTYFSQNTVQVPANYSVHAGSAVVQKAIDFAMAQRGKPYVWGAAGPGSYDCSGLTMAAFAAAGISLPHSAAGQYNYGTQVPLSAMQPGDLVFFYTPIGHVGIYIGNGMMVSAPTSGDVVKVQPIFSGAVGAKRLA